MNKVLKIVSLLFLVTIFSMSLKAQTSTYCFNQSSGTYTPITGGAILVAADDAVYTATLIGFTFTFNGVSTYTSCVVSTNGFITFGSTSPATTLYTPISGTTAYAGAVSAMGGDLTNSGATSPEMRYQTLGTSPNRSFVMQWKNWRRYSGAALADVLNFQIILYEGTNKIDIVYGSNTAASTAVNEQVGLRGATNADFNNRSTTSNWAATTAGGANTVTCATSNAILPASGLTFSYSPSVVVSVSPAAATICNGSNTTLMASGAATYAWSPSTGLSPTTGSNVTAAPSANTTYTVTGTTGACNSTKTVTVTVIPTLTVTANGSASTVCAGTLVTLTGGGATSYSWSGGVTNGVGFVPTATTTYTVTGTTGSCSGTKTITVTVNSSPTVAINPSTPFICNGLSTTITASGASTYAWNPATGLNASTGAIVIANPVATTNYTVTGTDALGCTSKLPFTVTVNPTPTVTISPASAIICSGSNTILTASGATTYVWSPTTGLNVSTGSSVIASPGSSLTYTVTGSNGCTSIKTVNVTVNSSPTVNVTSSSSGGALAMGGIITTSGAYTIHTFTTSGTFTPTGNLNVEYLVVAGGGGGGKENTSGNPGGGGGGAGGLLTGTGFAVTAQNYPITVGAGGFGGTVPPSNGANGSNSVFSSITAYGGGGGGYSWNDAYGGGSGGGGSYGQVDPGPPIATYISHGGAASPAGQGNKGGDGVVENYAGAGGGGAGTPGNNPGGGSGAGDAGTGGNGGAGFSSLITGTSVTYAAGGGGGTYSTSTPGLGGSGIGGNGGSNGSIGTNAIANTGSGGGGGGTKWIGSVDPANSGNGGNGSSGIVVIRYLTPSSNCSGTSTTLTANGASTYAWSPATGLSATTGAVVIATPAATTNYTVTGTANGCTNAVPFTVTVNSTPTVSISPSALTICSGSNTTLVASGASTYSWNPATGLSATTGLSVIANPTVTTNYTVTGTSSNGCVSNLPFTVTVNPIPVVLISPSSSTICSGSSSTLTVSGASTYAWVPVTGLNVSTGSSVIASPTSTITYTVTGTGSGGCVSTKTIIVTVNSSPTVAINPSTPFICNGLSATITASGASTYAWNPATGLNATTGAIVIANPVTTTNYTVTGTDALGCTNKFPFTVTVNPTPTVTISPSSATICSGSSTSLTASGATTYVWSPATGLNVSTGSSVIASPGTSLTYTVTGSNGCSSTKTVNVTVNSSPTVSISPSGLTLCNGLSSTLTVSGANTYVWSPSAGLSSTTGASVIANPTITTAYSVIGTTSGCSNSQTVVVTVSPVPTVINPLAGSRCGNGTVDLGATASAGTLNWYSVSSGGSILGTGSSFTTPSLSVTTTFYAEAANGGCTSSSRTSVLATIIPTVSPSVSIAITAGTNPTCSGVAVTFSAIPTNGGVSPSYQWKLGSTNVGTNSNTYSATLLSGGVVTCVMTSNATCPSPSTATSNGISMTVNSLPTVLITPSSSTICNGGTTTLTASGASGYVWAPVAGLSSTTGVSVLANPTITTTYSVTAVLSGCSNTAQVVITVIPSQISISPSVATICNGGSTNLTASGASTYAWAPSIGLSSTTGQTVSANPTVTTTYSVVGTTVGCGQSTKNVTVTVGGSCAGISCLVLSGGYINITGGTSTVPVFVVVDDASTAGIIRLGNGGHIYTNGQYNFVKWKAGTGTGNYVIPFGVAANPLDFIPFTFNKTNAASSDISASTWGTTVPNSPYPGISNVSAVTAMTGAAGEDASTTAIDRFWDIRTSAPTTADLSFSYRASENTISSNTELLKAQSWSGVTPSNPWNSPVGTGNFGVTSGIGTVGPIIGQTTFAPFVLVRASAPLQNISMVSSVTYAALKKRLDGGYFTVTNNKLYFTYAGEYNNGTLNYKLFDHNRIQVATSGLGNLTRNFGDNRYVLDFSSSPLIAGQYYILEVTSEKNEVYLLKFKY